MIRAILLEDSPCCGWFNRAVQGTAFWNRESIVQWSPISPLSLLSPLLLFPSPSLLDSSHSFPLRRVLPLLAALSGGQHHDRPRRIATSNSRIEETTDGRDGRQIKNGEKKKRLSSRRETAADLFALLFPDCLLQLVEDAVVVILQRRNAKPQRKAATQSRQSFGRQGSGGARRHASVFSRMAAERTTGGASLAPPSPVPVTLALPSSSPLPPRARPPLFHLDRLAAVHPDRQGGPGMREAVQVVRHERLVAVRPGVGHVLRERERERERAPTICCQSAINEAEEQRSGRTTGRIVGLLGGSFLRSSTGRSR